MGDDNDGEDTWEERRRKIVARREASAKLDAWMDAVTWRPTPWGDDEPGGLHATHEGVLSMPGAEFRCYQLSDGQRVLDADDVMRFFSGGEQMEV